MKDLREELKQMNFDLELTQKVYCKNEEEKQFRMLKKEGQPLPDDVKMDEIGYFRYVNTDLTEEEKNHLFLYRQLSYLKSIKNSMIFFVILTVVSLIISLIIALR